MSGMDRVDSGKIPQQTALGQPPEVPGGGSERETTSEVPQEVITSQKEAHQDPEASGNDEMVKEKQEMEQELLKKVQEQK